MIELMALDSEFNIVSLLNYTNLQWSRKYYESGTFSVEIPAGQYNADMAYIYTKDRPELGRITQKNYCIKQGAHTVNLSGYFLEEDLNAMVAYQPASSTNITNAPTWALASGKAENVAFTFFNSFKEVTIDGTTYSLGITAGTSQGRGAQAEHQRGNQYLGNKIYTILKPSLMSYRVRYDWDTSERTFECWRGVDRTQDNTEQNNPIIFSTAYGNLDNVDLLLATTEHKNGYISVGKDGDNIYVEGASENTEAMRDKFLYVGSNANIGDYDSEADFIEAIKVDGHEGLLDKTKTVSLEFDTIQSSYEYLVDFDLGDVCSLEIPEITLSMDAVISAIYEVAKKGTWQMTMELTTL